MPRFRAIDDYQAPVAAGYRLLPFRFTALDSASYVLTNLAGEYQILSREALHALVHHELSSESPEYIELRARHFLQDSLDTAAPELLALKVRTRFRHLPEMTALHIFVVTLRCEHSCPYCQVSRQTEDRAAYDMTPGIADKALDVVFQSPSRAIKIEFQGGEPLLNFELIRHVVDRAERRNAAAKRDLRFVIATNLALATPEILSFCASHDVDISTSLDGPEDLHNQNRPRAGRNSHQKALEGIQSAREIIGRDRVSALMTTTSRSLDRGQEIIDEYVRLGFPGIFLRPLSPYGFAVRTNALAAYTTARWLTFYKQGLDYILHLNRVGVPFRELYASIILKKMLTADEPGFVDLMNPSGIGLKVLVYNYDGAVYASDESRMLAEMGDETFRIGDLGKDSYADILLSERLLDPIEQSMTTSVPMCSDCAFEPFCGADPVFHHAAGGDVVGRKPESAFCSRNMEIFRHLITRMRDDPVARQIFLGWANQ